jgi:hypothetical protein
VFQGLKPSDSQYLPKLKELMSDLKEHMKKEEEDDLPSLEKALSSQGEASGNLAKSFSRTKKFVPTRSHPAAGEHPPFETVMALLVAPIDKVADMFRKFPEE